MGDKDAKISSCFQEKIYGRITPQNTQAHTEKKTKKTVKSAETKHSRKIAVNQAPYSQLTANRAIHQFYSTAWKERNLVTYETVEFDRQAHILHN